MIPVDSPPLSSSCWWVFCRVIDNFGDAGVAWRLVRQLAARQQNQVHFIIDHLTTLARLDSRIRVDDGFPQSLGCSEWGDPVIQVWPWALVERDVTPLAEHGVPECIISAFSCDWPATVMAHLAGISKPPPWLLFDYLSAERWVEDCHGLPAPRPDYSGERYFFFPGFTTGTGGLLREPNLLATRDTWLKQSVHEPDSSAMVSCASPTDRHPRRLTLWCYPHAPVEVLSQVLAEEGEQWHWTLFEGEVWAERLATAQQAKTSQSGKNPSVPWSAEHEGNTRHEYQRVPFQTQEGYDRLLWQSDLNLVRGEDSLVRGIWAGKPFLWHIYPQAEGAHRLKLNAFLMAYLVGVDERLATPLSALFRAWNGDGDLLSAWRAMRGLWPVWQRHAQRWSRQLAQQPDLVGQLVNFVNNALK